MKEQVYDLDTAGQSALKDRFDAQQSCVSTSTGEHEAEQQRLATRMQQEANQQQIDPGRHQIYMQPGWPPSGDGQYRDLGDPGMTPLQRRKMPFSDRPIVDQIEILRSEVLDLRRANSRLQHSFEEVLNHLRTFLQHEHVNGKVMVPAGNSSFGSGQIAKLARSYDPLA